MSSDEHEGARDVPGLRVLNIVLVGEGFPVDKVKPDEFYFNGTPAVAAFRVPQLMQAQANEYSIQILPDRFQVAAATSKATQFRMDALTSAARYFVEEFTSKRSIAAVGHNFSGIVDAPGGNADDFLRRLTLPPSLTEAFRPASLPRQALISQFMLDEFTSSQVKLEPSVEEPGRLFYDINISWNGQDNIRHGGGVIDLINLLPGSAGVASGVVSRVVALQQGGSEE